ncbi:MAG: PEP-CTERM sorting domain-containing protein [Verrucomicrobiota bacterium]
MKLNKTLIAGSALSLFLAASASAATVTLQMSQGVTNAVNFADQGGTPQAGLTWGIIVDSGNNGVDFANLLGATLSTTTDGIQLGGSDDYLFISGNLSGTLPNIPAFGAEANATGQLSNIAGITTEEPGTNPVAVGQPFLLVWFGTGVNQDSSLAGGESYGVVSDASFQIPAGGATVSYAAVFAANPDPVRPADQLVVPEPSVALLGGLGLLGLLRRRR